MMARSGDIVIEHNHIGYNIVINVIYWFRVIFPNSSIDMFIFLIEDLMILPKRMIISKYEMIEDV